MFLISTHYLGNQQKSVSASDQSFFHELFKSCGLQSIHRPLHIQYAVRKGVGFLLTYEQNKLGNINAVQKDSMRMCSPQSVFWGTGLEGDRLKWPYYLSRVDHNWKIRNRRQRMDIRKYSFVNRTIRLRNRLPAKILGALPCKPNTFRKRVRNMINEVN